jgi:hypothetical protein
VGAHKKALITQKANPKSPDHPKTMDKPASLLSAHMNTLITWKQFAKEDNLQRVTRQKTRVKTDAIDVSRHGLDIAYLKAIIVEYNY